MIKAVNTVREAIDIAMTGQQASVAIGSATMVSGNSKDIIFADPDCYHSFDDGYCLLCDESEQPGQEPK